MRAGSVAAAVLAAVMAAAPADAQDDPPVLHPFGGGYECDVTQTLEGDVINLSCVAVDSPLADDFDYEVFNVERYVPSFSGGHWLKFKLRTNVDVLQILLEYTFYPVGEQHGIVENSSYDSDLQDLRRGQQVSVTVIPDVLGSDVSWDRVDIRSRDGFRCKGCGAYAAADLPESDEINLDSIDPADLSAVLNEVSNRMRYGR